MGNRAHSEITSKPNEILIGSFQSSNRRPWIVTGEKTDLNTPEKAVGHEKQLIIIMKKLILLFFICIVSLSCGNQDSELIAPDELVELSEEQSLEIVNSDEYQAYFTLRYEFLESVKIALSKGYNAEQLTQISIVSLSNNDHEIFYETIFNSYSNGVKYVEKLKEAQLNLFAKFPILYSIDTEQKTDLSESQVSAFYKNLETRGFDSNDYLSNGRINAVVCGSYWQQVKLLGCSGLCGVATAGAGAVLCGWACWCMLCHEYSFVADAIC